MVDEDSYDEDLVNNLEISSVSSLKSDEKVTQNHGRWNRREHRIFLKCKIWFI